MSAERERPGSEGEHDPARPAEGLETTRREFLVVSTGAIAAATLPLEMAKAAPRSAALVRGPEPFPIALTVNRLPRHVDVTPGTTLAEVLRVGSA